MDEAETLSLIPSRPLMIGLCSPVMGSGKTTFAEALVRNHGFVRLSVAATLKAMVQTFLQESGLDCYDAKELITDPDLKEYPIKELNWQSPRYAMQTLGTEWGRELLGDDIWIGSAIRKAQYLMSQGQSVVFDDVRFENEAQAIVKASGAMVRVWRPGTSGTATGHASEGQLDNYPCAYTIINDSTPKLLEIEAANLLKHF